MCCGFWVHGKIYDLYVGGPKVATLDAKDKYTVFLKKSQIWVVPLGSLCVGILTASIVSI